MGPETLFGRREEPSGDQHGASREEDDERRQPALTHRFGRERVDRWRRRGVERRLREVDHGTQRSARGEAVPYLPRDAR
jgi:hypothetical protein